MKHVNVALEWWTCCRIGSAEIWKPIQRYAYVTWWQFDSRYVCVCLSLRIVLMVKSVGRQMSVGRCVCVCVVSLRAVHCIASRNIFVGKLQFINDGIWQRWPKKRISSPVPWIYVSRTNLLILLFLSMHLFLLPHKFSSSNIRCVCCQTSRDLLLYLNFNEMALFYK